MEEKYSDILNELYNKFSSQSLNTVRIDHNALEVYFKTEYLNSDICVMIIDCDMFFGIYARVLKCSDEEDEIITTNFLKQINSELKEKVPYCHMYNIDVDKENENILSLRTFPVKGTSLVELYHNCLNIASIIASFLKTLEYQTLNNSDNLMMIIFQPPIGDSSNIFVTKYLNDTSTSKHKNEEHYDYENEYLDKDEPNSQEIEELRGSEYEYLDYLEQLNDYSENDDLVCELKELYIKTAEIVKSPDFQSDIQYEVETSYINATRVEYYNRQFVINNLKENSELYLLPPPNEHNNIITIINEHREEIGIVGNDATNEILENISKGCRYILFVDSFNHYTSSASIGVKIKVLCYRPVVSPYNSKEKEDRIRDDIISYFDYINWHPKLKNLDDGYAITLNVPIKYVHKLISSDNVYSIVISKTYRTADFKIISPLPISFNTRDSVDKALPIVKDVASKIFINESSYKILPNYSDFNMGIDFIFNDHMSVIGKEKESIFKSVQGVAILTHRYTEAINAETQRIVATQKPSSEIQSSKSEGCYIATCVYGSYDCPQVWTLRRYRDNTLATTWYGKAFIRTYYAISPTLVKWFGHTNWFKKLWVRTLNKMVESLQSNGVESTPYSDENE